MAAAQLLRRIWRRKWIVVATVVLTTAGTYFTARALPPVYESEATLFVQDRSDDQDAFQALQSSQSIAKTYAELIQSRNVADEVVDALGLEVDAARLLEDLTFEPIPETQLVVITAQRRSAGDAAQLANAYANTFIRYARESLSTKTSSEVSVVDRALPPEAPIRPRPALYAGIMLALGLLLGAGLALLRDELDSGLADEEDITRAFGLPVLAFVPRVARRKLGSSDEQIFLESFRILRASLQVMGRRDGVRSLLVTSAEQGEGKTTTAVALARVLAEHGARVLIIEADMRRPALSQSLELDPAVAGLSQYLSMDADFEDVIYSTAVPNMMVLPAGGVSPNASTLLQPEALRALVVTASENVDWLIIDSPPISAGADASIIAGVVRDLLFVVSQRTTRRARAVAALRQLSQAGATPLGLVVNDTQGSATTAYYEYAGRPKRKDMAMVRGLTGSPNDAE